MVGISLEAVNVVGRPAQPQIGGFAVFRCAIVIGRFQNNVIVNMALQLVGAGILLIIRKEVKVWRFAYLFQSGDFQRAIANAHIDRNRVACDSRPFRYGGGSFKHNRCFGRCLAKILWHFGGPVNGRVAVSLTDGDTVRVLTVRGLR